VIEISLTPAIAEVDGDTPVITAPVGYGLFGSHIVGGASKLLQALRTTSERIERPKIK
jgi:hypothetical protein